MNMNDLIFLDDLSQPEKKLRVVAGISPVLQINNLTPQRL
jgi:hypothetical protein